MTKEKRCREINNLLSQKNKKKNKKTKQFIEIKKTLARPAYELNMHCSLRLYFVKINCVLKCNTRLPTTIIIII